MRRKAIVWTAALVAATVLQHYLPGLIGTWLGALCLLAAFDISNRVSWRPWWQTVGRMAAGLLIVFLIGYQSAHDSAAARDFWILIMAMIFGGFHAVVLYRWLERRRGQSFQHEITKAP